MHPRSRHKVRAADIARLRPRLVRFAHGRLRNPTQAEDAVQEALVAALESIDGFTRQSSLSTWLIGILKHKITDCVRKFSRERWLELGEVENPPDDDPRNDPFESLFRKRFLESGSPTSR